MSSLEGDYQWDFLSDYPHDVVVGSKHVHIVVDYDVDGLAAGAILYQYLDERGIDVSVKTFSRSEGFGVKPEHLKKDCLNVILDRGSPEVGRGVYEGYNVLIIDHHDCGGKPEDNVALVNPRTRQSSKYPCSSLIAFRLWGSKRNLPLALLGTLGDVCVLDKDTHDRLYHQWQDDTPWGRFSSPEKVRFDIIPKLNACGRVGDSRIALEYLLKPSQIAWKGIKEIHRKRRQEAQELQPIKVVALNNVVFAQYPSSASGHISYFAQRFTHGNRIGVAGYFDPNIHGYRVSIRSNVPCLTSVYNSKRFLVGGHANAGGGFIAQRDIGEFLEHLDNVARESRDKWGDGYLEISPRDLEDQELLEALEQVSLNPPVLFTGNEEWLGIEKICRERKRPTWYQNTLHWGTPREKMVCSVSSFRRKVSLRWLY